MNNICVLLINFMLDALFFFKRGFFKAGFTVLGKVIRGLAEKVKNKKEIV